MPARSVAAYANANGADAVLDGIAGVLQKGNAAWVNLEGVTSTLGTPETAKTYTFEGPPAFAPALAGAGIDVVTMGNNHSVDYGRAALNASSPTAWATLSSTTSPWSRGRRSSSTRRSVPVG